MSAPPLRPRTVTEILDAAFHVYRAHFMPLTLLAALVVFPIIVASVLLGIVTASMEGQGAGDESTSALAAGAGMAFFLSIPVISLWFVVAQAALQKGISDAYLGEPVSWTGALRHVVSRFWRLVGASIVKGLAIFAPTIVAAIVGGIFAAQAPVVIVFLFVAMFVAMFFLFLRLALIPATVVLEDTSVGVALRRSWELSEGHGGRILGGILLAYLIMFALQLTVMGIVAVASNFAIAQVASNLGSVVTYPIVAGVVVLLYYDLRIRKEGFDLEVMSAELARLPERPESAATRRMP